ncbi:MAG: DUF3943 domain-containing protein [Clostridium sp.]|nr:DUF3943 domain-containing protein [Clostridium sp.]
MTLDAEPNGEIDNQTGPEEIQIEKMTVLLTDTAMTAVTGTAVEKPSKKKKPNIYDMPYSMTESYANWGRLMGNTGVLVAGGAATLVILELLPEESTAWSRSEQKHNSMWERYRKHFHEGPVWDGDKFIFNGILHPYGGAAYYMSARSCGFNVWGSFLYSFCISTFFWEYGVECFMEIPSVQDLVVTPVIGSIFGEGFYLAKRAILRNNYRVLGSKFLGYFLAFLVDPVNELIGYFRGDQRHWCRDHELDKTSTTVNLSPQFGGGYAGLALTVTF